MPCQGNGNGGVAYSGADKPDNHHDLELLELCELGDEVDRDSRADASD